jgi:hypothetical protein
MSSLDTESTISQTGDRNFQNFSVQSNLLINVVTINVVNKLHSGLFPWLTTLECTFVQPDLHQKPILSDLTPEKTACYFNILFILIINFIYLPRSKLSFFSNFKRSKPKGYIIRKKTAIQKNLRLWCWLNFLFVPLHFDGIQIDFLFDFVNHFRKLLLLWIYYYFNNMNMYTF